MMDQNANRLTADNLAQLAAYLDARHEGTQPAPGEPGFPSGFSGELLRLAESNSPRPEFTAHLEQQLREAGRWHSRGRLPALWKSSIPERNSTMKRLAAFALVGIILFATLWVALPSIFPLPTPTQLVLATPPTSTPAPSPAAPLTPTVIPTTSPLEVAIYFTPQPIPSQPPTLPSLADFLSAGFGGSGSGNLPEGLPVTLQAELPPSPKSITAYYRLENNPVTLAEAQQIAEQWGLEAGLYMPAWMETISPDETFRTYTAVDGNLGLVMVNDELYFSDASISPVYEGHQYPQASLPPPDEAVMIATRFLSSLGLLDYPYRTGLSHYAYGLVDFYPMLESVSMEYPAASVRIDDQGRVGTAWINRADYQAVGSYPLISASQAWDILSAGQPAAQVSISYRPAQDGNPQYWGRVYQLGESAHLFGKPTHMLPVEAGATVYIKLNNLVLSGDLADLSEYLEDGGGYIHAWGDVVEANGVHILELTGWEPFDEFSGYYNGTLLRTGEADFLRLEDGRQLRLTDLPADVPADIPLYAEGGLVGETLEWFILQVHPADEGQLPPDLSQAQAVIDKVELVYLAPGLNNMPPDMALDPAYRMLIPAWRFSGTITNVEGADLVYQAYVQAVFNP
jgi:hypothetical protein